MRKKHTLIFLVLASVLLLIALLFRGNYIVDGIPAPIARARSECFYIVKGAKAYQSEYSSFPTGSSFQIASALSGENPKRIVFIGMQRTSTGADGQFVDPWGQPYVITFHSTTNVVVRSAGKDKVFGTSDDIEAEK